MVITHLLTLFLYLIKNSFLIAVTEITTLANSDHCGLSLSLSWKVSQRHAPVCPRRVWRYKDVDFPKAMGMIDAINWSSACTP